MFNRHTAKKIFGLCAKKDFSGLSDRRELVSLRKKCLPIISEEIQRVRVEEREIFIAIVKQLKQQYARLLLLHWSEENGDQNSLKLSAYGDIERAALLYFEAGKEKL